MPKGDEQAADARTVAPLYRTIDYRTIDYLSIDYRTIDYWTIDYPTINHRTIDRLSDRKIQVRVHVHARQVPLSAGIPTAQGKRSCNSSRKVIAAGFAEGSCGR